MHAWHTLPILAHVGYAERMSTAAAAAREVTEETPEHDADEGAGDEGEASDEAPAKDPRLVSLPRASRPVALPRAARPPQVSAVQAGVPITIFGAVPREVTHWLAKKQTATGQWEPCGWAPPGAIAELTEFPLAELTEETFRDRWGAGLYEFQWVRHAANGGRNVLRATRSIRILPPPAAAAPPPAPPAPAASPLGDSFTLAMQIMQMIDRQSDAKLTGMAQLATLMSGQQSRGLGAAELELILSRQAESTRAQVAAAVEPLQARLAAFEGGDDDEDEGPDVVEHAARAAGPAFFRGGKWWQQAGAYASQNPEMVKAVAPVALGAVQSVIDAIKAVLTAPPPPRPRAVPAAPPASAPALHGEQPSASDVEQVQFSMGG